MQEFPMSTTKVLQESHLFQFLSFDNFFISLVISEYISDLHEMYTVWKFKSEYLKICESQHTVSLVTF